MLLFIRISFLILGFTLSTQSFASTWEETKGLYDSYRYEEALKSFLDHPENNAAYYYNLGTLYYKLHNLGASVAYLEKSNHLKPHDPDIQFNLTLARMKLGQAIGQEKLDPSSTWTEQLADRVSLDEVRSTLGLLGLIVVLLWIRAYVKTRNLKKMIFQPAGIIGLVGLVITICMYGIQRWAEAYPPVVCLEKQAIRSGPGAHYAELAQIDGGSKLRLLGPSAQDSALNTLESTPGNSQEIWRQVRYSEDGVGWVKAAGLLTL